MIAADPESWAAIAELFEKAFVLTVSGDELIPIAMERDTSRSGAPRAIGLLFASMRPEITAEDAVMIHLADHRQDHRADRFLRAAAQEPSGLVLRGLAHSPPLSQPVYWLVYKTPMTLDINQFGEYQPVANAGSLLPDARPEQPILGRQLSEIDNQVNYAGGSMST